ncbi:hypothetical protein VP424E501_P0138 [Vibrio phage 424E50-1]|nr:hypothetical protein VP424E501_P0138 [Vibrio phage 424E50-1]
MKTHTIIKGCETLDKLQRSVKDNYNLKDFIRIYDTTTQHELMEAIQKVLTERKKTVADEIKSIVNE